MYIQIEIQKYETVSKLLRRSVRQNLYLAPSPIFGHNLSAFREIPSPPPSWRLSFLNVSFEVNFDNKISHTNFCYTFE